MSIVDFLVYFLIVFAKSFLIVHLHGLVVTIGQSLVLLLVVVVLHLAIFTLPDLFPQHFVFAL